MKPIYYVVTVLLSLLIWFDVAEARCITERFNFFIAQNYVISVESRSDNGRCAIDWMSASRVGDNGYSLNVYSNIVVITSPLYGSFGKLNLHAVSYTARGDLKSGDRMSFKVCGRNSAGSGCSTLNWHIRQM